MDAANHFRKTATSLLIAALAVAMPALAQPALNLSPTTVTLNQSTTFGSVHVTSSGDPITFTPSSPVYASDGSSGAWLTFEAGSSGAHTTTADIGVQIATTAGSTIGQHQATITLTPSSPAGVQPVSFTVVWNNGSGGGGSSGTISLGKTSTSLSVASGQGTFDNITVSTTSTTNITLQNPTVATTTCGSGWLSASLNTLTINSASSATLTVQVSSVGLSAATCNGTVTVTPTVGNSVTLNVTMTVGTGTSGSLSVSPSTFNLNYFSGGAFPSQIVTITDPGASSVTVSSNQTWLTVNGNSTAVVAPGTITVGLSSVATGLSTGTYTASLTYLDNFGNQVQTSVNLIVNSGSTAGLTVSPTSLTFTAALGGASQQNVVTVNSNQGGTFTATPTVNWIQAVPNTNNLAANTQGSVTVTVTPGGLSNNTYTGAVNIQVGSQTYGLSVTMVIGTGSGGGSGTSSNVAPNSVQLSWQSGTDPGFVNRPQIQITGTPGSWSSSASTAQGGNWLSLDPAVGSTLPATATIVVNPNGLSAGSYSGTISITTPGGVQTVTVALTVSSGAVLTSRPGSVIFTAQQGGSAPAGQSVFFSVSDISLNASLDITNTVVANAPWITVVTSQKAVQVFASQTGLSNGLYSGSITVSPSGIGSLTVPVVLQVGDGTGGGGGTSGPLTFSPASLSFNSAVSTIPPAQVIGVSATSSTTFSVSSDQSWLIVTPTTGTTNTNLSVSVSSLPAGTYSANLTFTTSGATQTVPVTYTVSSSGGGGNTGNVTVSPASLSYSAQTTTGNPSPQMISVNSKSGNVVNFSVTATTTSGGSWLVAPAGTFQTPQSGLSVSVNIAGLAAGTYQGNLAVNPSGGDPVNVPVTLTITSPTTVSATPASLSFSYRGGGVAPAAQQIQVTGSGPSLPFAATVSSSATWLSVTPASGTTSATANTPTPLSVTVNPGTLTAGTYNGTITVAGTGSAVGSTVISVTLTVTVPLPTVNRVTNAASYAVGSISPGEIITLFGTDMGPATPAGLQLDSNGKVATTLSGVQVTVGGYLAPLIYVSNTQISAVVPYELAQFTSGSVLVKYLGQSSNGVTMNVSTTAPGIFTLNASGTGPGAILNQNGSTNSPSAPAARGDTVVIYMTGEGQTSPSGVTGKVTTVSATPPLTPAPLLQVSVTIGGLPANFSFAGEAPGFVSGVMQLNVTIPSGASTGDQPIVVSVGSNRSQTGVTVSVR